MATQRVAICVRVKTVLCWQSRDITKFCLKGMVRFARSFIAAPDAKGLKGAEKGLKGNLYTNNPFGPL